MAETEISIRAAGKLPEGTRVAYGDIRTRRPLIGRVGIKRGSKVDLAVNSEGNTTFIEICEGRLVGVLESRGPVVPLPNVEQLAVARRGRLILVPGVRYEY